MIVPHRPRSRSFFYLPTEIAKKCWSCGCFGPISQKDSPIVLHPTMRLASLTPQWRLMIQINLRNWVFFSALLFADDALGVSVGKWAFVWWIASKIPSTLSINFPFRIYLLFFLPLLLLCSASSLKCDDERRRATKRGEKEGAGGVYKKFITLRSSFRRRAQKAHRTRIGVEGEEGDVLMALDISAGKKTTKRRWKGKIVSRSIKICHTSAIILWSNCVLVSHLLALSRPSIFLSIGVSSSQFNKFSFRLNYICSVDGCSGSPQCILSLTRKLPSIFHSFKWNAKLLFLLRSHIVDEIVWAKLFTIFMPACFVRFCALTSLPLPCEMGSIRQLVIEADSNCTDSQKLLLPPLSSGFLGTQQIGAFACEAFLLHCSFQQVMKAFVSIFSSPSRPEKLVENILQRLDRDSLAKRKVLQAKSFRGICSWFKEQVRECGRI